MEQKVPYKIYLEENEIPKAWFNVRADMKNKPAPLLNPATLQPMGIDDLKGVFCEELCKQELDNDTAFFPIPEEIRDFYKNVPSVTAHQGIFPRKGIGHTG